MLHLSYSLIMELSICKSLVTGEDSKLQRETLSTMDDTVYGLGIITPKYLAFSPLSLEYHQSKIFWIIIFYIYIVHLHLYIILRRGTVTCGMAMGLFHTPSPLHHNNHQCLCRSSKLHICHHNWGGSNVCPGFGYQSRQSRCR